MKKIISLSIAAMIISSSYCISYTDSRAAANPTLYFKSGDSTDSITVDVADGDVTVRVAMYIDTDITNFDNLRILWSEDSEYISLCNLLQPDTNIHPETSYSMPDGTSFSTSYIPTCFGKFDSRGNYTFSGSVTMAENPDPETGRITSAGSILYTSPDITSSTPTFKWFSGDSDAYMIADFDAVISSDTPTGSYSIYYKTSENLEISSYISTSTISENSSEYNHIIPDTKAFTINVVNSSDVIMGDITKDGVIDALDASQALAAYTRFSSGSGYGLDDYQLAAADVDKNGVINSIDASKILKYYTDISSGMEGSFD